MGKPKKKRDGQQAGGAPKAKRAGAPKGAQAPRAAELRRPWSWAALQDRFKSLSERRKATRSKAGEPAGPTATQVFDRTCNDLLSAFSDGERWENRETAWRVATAFLIDQAVAVDPNDVNHIWALARDIADEASIVNPYYQQRVLRDSAKLIFDLLIAPVALETPGAKGQEGTGFPSRSDRKESIPGLRVDQNVFLWPRSESDVQLPDGNALDEFAENMALSDAYDGVYCLTGVRGSGKSTVLNQIKWHALNWIDDRQPRRPLVIRFDLSSSFDTKKFTIDLMSEICRSVQSQCKQKPMSRRVDSFMVRLVGQVGRWCETNMRWAALVLFLGVMTFVLQHFTSPAPIFTPAAPQARPMHTQPAAFLFAGMIGCSIVLLGWAHWFLAPGKPARRGVGRRTRFGWAPLALLLCVPVWVLLQVATFCPVVGGLATAPAKLVKELPPSAAAWLDKAAASGWWPQVIRMGLVGDDAEQTVDPKDLTDLAIKLRPPTTASSASPGPDLGSALRFIRSSRRLAYLRDSWWAIDARSMFTLYAVWVLCWLAAMAMLPPWWRTYLYCQRLHAALRSAGGEDTAPELPQLSYISGLARLILPQASDLPDVRELETPFLQQALKELLERCTVAFGRVVVLIDDVDVLPSVQFHELFRILRPMNKVRKVCCIVCAPRYFFETVRYGSPGDVHSTVQQGYLLGDPDLYGDPPECAILLGDDPLQHVRDVQRFEQTLRKTFLSRMRLHIERSIGHDELAGFLKSDPIEFLVDQWNSKDNENFRNILDNLKHFGPSRREIIRETDALLDRLDRQPFRDIRKDIRVEAERVLSASKDDYNASETALLADVVGRNQAQEALEKIRVRSRYPLRRNDA